MHHQRQLGGQVCGAVASQFVVGLVTDEGTQLRFARDVDRLDADMCLR
jgi:hypothetical protein